MTNQARFIHYLTEDFNTLLFSGPSDVSENQKNIIIYLDAAQNLYVPLLQIFALGMWPCHLFLPQNVQQANNVVLKITKFLPQFTCF